MEQNTVFLTILGMTLVTFLPRLIPLWMLSSRSLPPLVVAWLGYVPVAVLAAMLFPAVLSPDGQLAPPTDNLFLWASIPTLLVAWKTRSMFSAVVTGMLVVAAARHIFAL